MQNYINQKAKAAPYKRYFTELRVEYNIYKNGKTEMYSVKVINSPMKRLFDLVLSILLFVFCFTIAYIVIGFLIKLTSKGPILFKQYRVGLNGKIFKCYKFRTMYVEKTLSKYTPTSSNDPRITPIGVFLRRSNLDELPQLINVLEGDMAIVGPRPHAIAFHEKYKQFIPEIDKRLMVKPGITGLAQIRGFRGDVFDEVKNKQRTIRRVLYDMIYIKNWSIKFDIYIIVLTAKQMLFRKTNGH